MSTRQRWVTVEDADGRLRRVQADEWLSRDLPRLLGAAWTDPDRLYVSIVKAIEIGAPAAVEEALLRLELLEGNTERQAVAQALVQIADDRPVEAEQGLRRHLRRHPMTAIVATNLAKTLWAQAREAEARTQLREGLSIDPNLENALLWWASIHGTEGGDGAYQQALLEVCAEKEAWRARLLLGRQYLQHGRVEEARSAFESILQDFPLNEEAAALAARELEGPAGVAAAPAPPQAEVQDPRLASIPLFSPVWTRGLEDPDWIFDEPAIEGTRICVFAFADARPGQSLSETRETPYGRLSRALPLALSESLMLRTDARVAAVIPVLLNCGLFLSTTAFNIETMVRFCPPVFPPRLVVSGTFMESEHLRLEVWDVELSRRMLSELLPATDPVRLAVALESRVAAIAVEAGLITRRPASHCARFIPTSSRLQEPWLQAQAQLLTQLLAASRVIPSQAIYNEGVIYEICFGLCGLYPDLLAPRLMAISSVLAGLHYGSPNARVFTEGVRALLSEAGPQADLLDRLSPLVLRRLGDEQAAAAAAARFEENAPASYLAWLRRAARATREQAEV